MTPLLSILLAIVAADAPEAVFAQANAAYGEGAHLEAARLYEQLVSDGVHDPVVFYNLGNAYFSAGRLGAAVANYERSLHLAPTFERARANLGHALSTGARQLARPLPPWWEQTVLFWHAPFSPRFSVTAAVVAWWGFWGLLCVRQVRPYAYSRVLLACSLLVAVAFGASAWAKSHPLELAVASHEEIPVYYAARPGNAVVFELFEGDRVRVEERHGGWVRIATADGRRGWVEVSAMTIVGPPYAPGPAAQPMDEAAGGAE